VIALVTDSNAMLPAGLRDRFSVAVVPLTIVVDGQPYAEGVEITTPTFYERLAAGATVSTAAPPPGLFVAAYEQAASAGADAVLSVHVGSNTSATVNSARVASATSPIPIDLVDTGTASFPVACCVWAAGVVLERGGTLEAARVAAETVADAVGNVFIVGALDLARRGGRLAADATEGDGAPVLALRDGTMEVTGRCHDVEGAVDHMVEAFARASTRGSMRVGVGEAAAPEIATALAERLRQRAEVAELIRYDVGPSVVAHTGLGTAGAVYFPTELIPAHPRS
jgi:DegV family protein with EDD domain